YEAGETIEARCARDADKLDCLLQAREYEEQGHAKCSHGSTPQPRPWPPRRPSRSPTRPSPRTASAGWKAPSKRLRATTSAGPCANREQCCTAAPPASSHDACEWEGRERHERAAGPGHIPWYAIAPQVIHLRGGNRQGLSKASCDRSADAMICLPGRIRKTSP